MRAMTPSAVRAKHKIQKCGSTVHRVYLASVNVRARDFFVRARDVFPRASCRGLARMHIYLHKKKTHTYCCVHAYIRLFSDLVALNLCVLCLYLKF